MVGIVFARRIDYYFETMAEDLSGLSRNKIQELRVLQELALPHVEASNGKFTLLDINPKLYPAQLSYHVESDQVQHDPAFLYNMGKMAYPKAFPKIHEGIKKAANETERLDFAAEMLKGGNNLEIVTDHGDLIDIALAEGAYSVELAQILGESIISKMRRLIVVSRIVSMIGIHLSLPNSDGNSDTEPKTAMPATSALGFLCNDIFLSYPRTPSIEGRVQKASIKAHNELMLAQLKIELAKGGRIFAQAPSGTKDKLIGPGDPDYVENGLPTYRLGTISDGTADLMTFRRTYVAPTAVRMDGDVVVSELVDMPRTLEGRDEAHGVMSMIANRLNERLEGRQRFVYSRTRITKAS
jgi:hypothetical protein